MARHHVWTCMLVVVGCLASLGVADSEEFIVNSRAPEMVDSHVQPQLVRQSTPTTIITSVANSGWASPQIVSTGQPLSATVQPEIRGVPTTTVTTTTTTSASSSACACATQVCTQSPCAPCPCAPRSPVIVSVSGGAAPSSAGGIILKNASEPSADQIAADAVNEIIRRAPPAAPAPAPVAAPSTVANPALQAELNAVKGQNQQLRTKNQELQNALATSQAQAAASKYSNANAATSDAAAAALRAQVAAEKSQVSDLESKLDAAKAEKLAAERAAAMAAIQKAREEYQRQLSTVETKYRESAEKAAASFQNEKQDLEDKLKNAKADLEDFMKNNNKTAPLQVQAMRNRVLAVQQQLVEAKRLHRQSVSQLKEDKEEQVRMLTAQLKRRAQAALAKEKNAEAALKESAIRQGEDYVLELTKKVAGLQRKAQELHNKARDLQAQHVKLEAQSKSKDFAIAGRALRDITMVKMEEANIEFGTKINTVRLQMYESYRTHAESVTNELRRVAPEKNAINTLLIKLRKQDKSRNVEITRLRAALADRKVQIRVERRLTHNAVQAQNKLENTIEIVTKREGDLKAAAEKDAKEIKDIQAQEKTLEVSAKTNAAALKELYALKVKEEEKKYHKQVIEVRLALQQQKKAQAETLKKSLEKTHQLTSMRTLLNKLKVDADKANKASKALISNLRQQMLAQRKELLDHRQKEVLAVRKNAMLQRAQQELAKLRAKLAARDAKVNQSRQKDAATLQQLTAQQAALKEKSQKDKDALKEMFKMKLKERAVSFHQQINDVNGRLQESRRAHAEVLAKSMSQAETVGKLKQIVKQMKKVANEKSKSAEQQINSLKEKLFAQQEKLAHQSANAHRLLQEKLQKERELKAAQKKVAGLLTKLSQQEKNLKESEARDAAKINKLKADKAKLSEDAKQKQSALKALWSSKLKETSTAYHQRIVKLRLAETEQRKKHAASVQKALGLAKDKAQLRKLMRELSARAKRQHRASTAQIKRLKERLAAKMKEMEAKEQAAEKKFAEFKKRHHKLQKLYKKDMARLNREKAAAQRKSDRQVKFLQKKLAEAARLRAKEKALRAESDRNLKKKLANEARIREIQAKRKEAAWQARWAALNRDKERARVALLAKMAKADAAAQAKLKKMSFSHASDRRKLNAMIEGLKKSKKLQQQQHAIALAKVKRDYEKRLSDQKRGYEKILAKIRADMAKLRRDFLAQIAALHANYKKQLATQKHKYETALQKLRLKCSQELSSCKKQAQAMKVKYETIIANLKRQHAAAIQRERNAHAATRKSLTDQLNKERTSHTRNTTEMRKMHNLALKKQKEDWHKTLRRLQDKHKRELQLQNRKHRQEMLKNKSRSCFEFWNANKAQGSCPEGFVIRKEHANWACRDKIHCARQCCIPKQWTCGIFDKYDMCPPKFRLTAAVTHKCNSRDHCRQVCCGGVGVGTGMCEYTGDPHMRSFDGSPWYDCQDPGEYILYKNNILDEEVHNAQKVCGNYGGRISVNCNYGVAMRARDNVFDYTKGLYRFNGKRVALTFKPQKTDHIFDNAIKVVTWTNPQHNYHWVDIINMESHTSIHANHAVHCNPCWMNVYVYLAFAPKKYETSGLCGRYDGNPHNDVYHAKTKQLCPPAAVWDNRPWPVHCCRSHRLTSGTLFGHAPPRSNSPVASIKITDICHNKDMQEKAYKACENHAGSEAKKICVIDHCVAMNKGSPKGAKEAIEEELVFDKAAMKPKKHPNFIKWTCAKWGEHYQCDPGFRLTAAGARACQGRAHCHRTCCEGVALGNGMCSSTGDPHIKSFDGAGHFDCQDPGEYIYYLNKVAGEEVHNAQRICGRAGNTPVSCNYAVAFRAHNKVFDYQKDTYRYNGKRVNLVFNPQPSVVTFGKQFQVRTHTNAQRSYRWVSIVNLETNTLVRINHGAHCHPLSCWSNIEIVLPFQRNEYVTEGVCGSFDGNRNNDVINRHTKQTCAAVTVGHRIPWPQSCCRTWMVPAKSTLFGLAPKQEHIKYQEVGMQEVCQNRRSIIKEAQKFCAKHASKGTNVVRSCIIDYCFARVHKGKDALEAVVHELKDNFHARHPAAHPKVIRPLCNKKLQFCGHHQVSLLSVHAKKNDNRDIRRDMFRGRTYFVKLSSKAVTHGFIASIPGWVCAHPKAQDGFFQFHVSNNVPPGERELCFEQGCKRTCMTITIK